MVGVTFRVVEFSYFGLYKVPCTEGLRSSAVYLGTSQGEDKIGARDKILHTKVARRACTGTLPLSVYSVCPRPPPHTSSPLAPNVVDLHDL